MAPTTGPKRFRSGSVFAVRIVTLSRPCVVLIGMAPTDASGGPGSEGQHKPHRLDEDHGTNIRSDTRVWCDAANCETTGHRRLRGHLHFTLDGQQYSRDSMVLCESHYSKLMRLVEGEV